MGVALQLGMLLLSPELWKAADAAVVDRFGVDGDSPYKQYLQAFVFLMLGSVPTPVNGDRFSLFLSLSL